MKTDASRNTRLPTSNRPLRILFLGISSRNSLIHKVINEFVGARDIEVSIACCDIPLATSGDVYRRILEDFKNDLSLSGAVVTAHKVKLFQAARDMFSELSAPSVSLEEVGALRRTKEGLLGHATDQAAVRRALSTVTDCEDDVRRDLILIGCGGAGLALVSVACEPAFQPRVGTIKVFEKCSSRRADLRRLFAQNRCDDRVSLLDLAELDATIEMSPERTLIVNATGLGKESNVSPLKDVTFPKGAVIWDFNYRGPLPFLRGARAQVSDRNIRVVDGLGYFASAWLEQLGFIAQIPISDREYTRLFALCRTAVTDQWANAP